VPKISYAQRLKNHADADPDHLAVTDENRSVTRRELESLANRTARALQAQGVVSGDRVTIALPNSAEFVATTVACLKLGATPQPVSSRLPPRELDAIIELAEPRVVVLQPVATDGFDDGPTRSRIRGRR
jgi:bile acid-coenzyme A ligase